MVRGSGIPLLSSTQQFLELHIHRYLSGALVRVIVCVDEHRPGQLSDSSVIRASQRVPGVARDDALTHY